MPSPACACTAQKYPLNISSIPGEAFEKNAGQERNISSDSEASVRLVVFTKFSFRAGMQAPCLAQQYYTQVKAEREAPDDVEELQKVTTEATRKDLEER